MPRGEGSVFTNLNTNPEKKPRLLGELGELSHAKVSSSDFKYTKETEIFGQSEPADYIYQVIEGAVRSHKLLPDGRRQIGAFHLPGDIFGFENGAFHRFTAEAIVETTVRLVKCQSLEREAKNNPAIIQKLLKIFWPQARSARGTFRRCPLLTSVSMRRERLGRVRAPGLR